MTKHDLPRQLAAARQIAAIATGFTLPFSTSGEAIAVSVFAVLALLTLDRPRAVATMRRPAAWLPVALFALILIGVLWSVQPFGAAIKWVGPYSKLLLIPLVMATLFTPQQALQVGYGFLAGCLFVLLLSAAPLLWPTGPWTFFRSPGVPFKDNAVQSGCFALGAFGLAIGAVRTWSADRRRAVVMIVLALAFFADIFLIFLSKTGAIMAAALVGLFVIHAGGWRRALIVGAVAVVVIGAALVASPQAQLRIAEITSDINGNSTAAGSSGGETLSTAARLDFWSKAIGFVKQAPLTGFGTGSIKPLYQSLEATRPSPYGEATPDPHNQTLHVVLQVGVIGGLLLWAMWLAHARMFFARDFASIIGQAVVLQNVIGSLFNSHISAVTQGMLYCLAVGLLASVVNSNAREATAP
ncbi:MAG: O-antigen ligase family protein [Tardiphaga sp.]